MTRKEALILLESGEKLTEEQIEDIRKILRDDPGPYGDEEVWTSSNCW
jgi:hypothetical protein